MVEKSTGTDDTLVTATPLKPAGSSAEGIGGEPPADQFGSDPLGGDDPVAAEEVSGPKLSTTERLKEEAGKLGSQAAERARAFAGEGKERATGALDEVARMMQSAAGDVEAKLGADYGRYARSAADGITSFADTLRGKEVDDLLDDAAAFVRKSPVVAVGVAAGVGFVLARLIKSGIDAAADLADRDDGDKTGNG